MDPFFTICIIFCVDRKFRELFGISVKDLIGYKKLINLFVLYLSDFRLILINIFPNQKKQMVVIGVGLVD